MSQGVGTIICLPKTAWPPTSGEKKCRNGADVPADAKAGVLYRVYGESGEFLMVAEGKENGALKTVKSFFEV